MSNAPTALVTALADRYRVERELGAGGMATVYLAEDLKHGRKVALKVLKPELAAVLGAERFVQEIKTTASLQHPHILPLFDSGTASGFLFYVMPYIEGETIREKLNRETQFGVDEAVRIAREVADALDYAHRHGVIHRDIKPENILLHDGRAMVMDFGIALAVSAAAGGRMTETGLSLGTPHYMSPEQATAEKEITARSDIYSMGSVLYEMLTGNPPHTGASAQQVIMKIITEPAADVAKFRKSVPRNVAAAIARSLEKLAADRFESAKAFADALGNPGYTSATFAASAEAARTARRRVSAPVLAASLLATLALAGWISTASRSITPPVKRTRFTIVVPDSARIRPEEWGQNFAISPDGSSIVYPGGEATEQLYLRNLNDLRVTPIPGTETARQTKFSPDGKWIGFVQNNHLVKVPLSGGPAVTVADSALAFAWGDGDVIVFTWRGSLWRVNGGGGSPALVVSPDSSKSETFVWPFLLPQGKSALFDIVTAGDQANAQLAVVRLDDRKIVRLGVAGRNPRYVATGHILFGHLDGAVSAAPFDVRSLRVTGPAVTVLDNVFIKSGGASEYAVSQDGTLFFVQGDAYGQVLAVDHNGGSRPLLSEKRSYSLPTFSPTSDRFAFHMAERTSFSKSDIWVYNDRTRTTTRLTSGGNSTAPAWMADGERVVWMVRDSAGVHVRRQRWDGSGTPETLFGGDQEILAVAPAPRGNLWAVIRNGGYSDIFVAEGDPPGKPRPLVVTPMGEGGARISSDGRWVAYYGDDSGQREVYVIAMSGDGGRHQISLEGGGEPVWAPDGKTLYYRAGGKMIAAGIVTTPTFTVTSRQVLFPDHFRGTGTYAFYDVSRDGKTFLMIGNSNEAAQRIIVATGWLDELRERMAQGAKK